MTSVVCARALRTREPFRAQGVIRFEMPEDAFRGLAKLTCVTLLGALASNLLAHAASLLA